MKKTLENLSKAFIGESQARNRYTIYAKIAAKEGFNKISEIFLLTAENEREHAKWLMRLINDIKEKHNITENVVHVEADAPNVMGDTVANLKAAIEGEKHEYTSMYPEFAAVAKEEGFKDIAVRLRAIAKAEEHHEERYKKLLKEVENKTVFKKEEKVYWVCMKCGYVHEGTTPPKSCPSCSHPTEYFEIKCENY